MDTRHRWRTARPPTQRGDDGRSRWV